MSGTRPLICVAALALLLPLTSSAATKPPATSSQTTPAPVRLSDAQWRIVENALAQDSWKDLGEAMAPVVAGLDDPCRLERSAALLVGLERFAAGNSDAAAQFFYCGDTGQDGREWLEWATQFSQDHPDSALGRLIVADALARGGNLRAARDNLRELLASEALPVPYRPAVECILGVVQWLAGGKQEEDAARNHLRSAAAAGLQAADLELGVLELAVQSEKRAEEAFREVLERDPTNSLALNGMAVAVHLKSGSQATDEIRQMLEKADKRSPFVASNLRALRRAGSLGQQGARGSMTTTLGGSLNLGVLKVNASHSWDWERGGVYTGGATVTVSEHGAPNLEAIGTWFALNYPFSESAQVHHGNDGRRQ
jgi:tetratricopeptide (TPR) repeat protein